LELRQLRYFLAMARTRNFTRAAEDVHIAQPPFSRQITQLEEELGARLLDREARPIALTEAGELVREQASEIIARIEQLKADVRSMASGHRRPFRIGLEVSLLYGRIPEVIKRVRAELPEVEFDLIELRAADQIDALKAGHIDAGLTHYAVRDEAVEHVLLREERLCVAFAPGNSLERQSGEKIPLRLVAGERMIFYREDDGEGRLDPGHDLLARHGIYPERVREVRDLQAALGLVAAEVGVCIAPESVRKMRATDVHYRSIAEADAIAPILLSFRRGVTSDMVAHILRVADQLARE